MLSQDGTLSIQDVSYDKAGEYMCVGAVPSVPGLTAQASVSLTVKGNTLTEMCTRKDGMHKHTDTFTAHQNMF